MAAPLNCHIAPSKSWRRLRLVLALAACCLLAQSTDAAPVRAVRRVLILHALGSSSPASILVDQGIRAALDKAPYQIELYSESMQGILFSDPASQRELAQEYIRKYRERRPDVVIALSPSPIKFMAQSGNKFGPTTPVVICASSEDQLEGVKLDSRFTGAWRTVNAAKTVEVALQLQPGTRHVVVVGGGVYDYDKRLMAIVSEQLHSYESRFEFTYLTNLEMPALLDQLKRLPEHSIILYTAISQDAAGTRFLDETQSLPLVVGAANAPVFVMEDTFVGQGTIGGYVTSYGDEGRVAGQLAVRILKGEKPQDIPIAKDANVYMFDWRALQRWGFRESALPPGSVVLFLKPTAWQLYKRYIVGAAFLGFAEMMLILALLWQRATRRKAEEAVRESEARFSLVANTAPMLIWMSDTHKSCNYFNDSWLAFTGRPAELELGNGWSDGVHREDLQRCLGTYTRAFDAREKFSMEYRLRRYDGEYRWVLDIGVPRYSQDGSFAGYIGSCVDVTDRRLAEEALSDMNRGLIEAQERERARIARELHDDIGQRLALLVIDLERLQENSTHLPVEARSSMDELPKRTSEIATDIQSLSHELHSSKLEYLGLAAAMRSFCREFGEHQNVEIDFKTHDLPNPLSSDVSLCLFRVLQEALHNSAKHSGVRNIEVGLWGTSDEIHLAVSDSGAGFDREVAKENRGLGLVSMEERLKLVKGTFSIESQPKRGTTIHARVPLSSRSDSMRAAG